MSRGFCKNLWYLCGEEAIWKIKKDCLDEVFWQILLLVNLKLTKLYKMFTISNKTYASAGNLLKKNGWVGFSCKTSDNIIEIPINDDDIKIKDNMFVWNAGKLQIPVIPNGTYGEYKNQ